MTALVLGGRAIQGAGDSVRRYCGLAWSGGSGETWACRYYDAVPDSDPMSVLPVDVLTAAVLSPGLAQSDLHWFWANTVALERLLGSLPIGIPLASAEADIIRTIERIPILLQTPPGVGLSLLSKVLHRKRPDLIPLLDKAALSHYRALVPARGAVAWPALVQAVQGDLRAEAAGLGEIRESVSAELDTPPTFLRIADIAIWMAAHGRVKGRPNDAQEA